MIKRGSFGQLLSRLGSQDWFGGLIIEVEVENQGMTEVETG